MVHLVLDATASKPLAEISRSVPSPSRNRTVMVVARSTSPV